MITHTHIYIYIYIYICIYLRINDNHLIIVPFKILKSMINSVGEIMQMRSWQSYRNREAVTIESNSVDTATRDTKAG